MDRENVIVGNKHRQHILDLALEIKLEEIRIKKKRDLTIVLSLSLFIAIVAGYGIYAKNRAISKRDKNFQEVITLIESAYEGDSRAHEEVVRRIPILTRSRLPRTLIETSNDSRISEINNPMTERFIVFTDEKEYDESKGVPLYVTRSDSSFKVGNINNDSGVISIEDIGEWSKVTLSSGVPAWVYSQLVTGDGSPLVRTVVDSVNLRSTPMLGSGSTVLGRVSRGTVLINLGTDGKWTRVVSPINFKYWIKSDELSTLL